MPIEYLSSYEPQFLLLQFYYIYSQFGSSKPHFTQPMTLVFKDHGRTPPTEKQASEPDDEAEVSPNHSNNLMGIIEEEDSQ